jgi:HAD superfamily hydrolase (TIGR01490 family)
MEGRVLALFDFDGTITTKDSAHTFYRFLYTSRLAYIYKNYVCCWWQIILLTFKLISYLPLKQRRLLVHTKGIQPERLAAIATEYQQKVLEKILIPKALERLQWHQQLGHEVWIVSASYDFILEKWCKENRLNLLTNETGYENAKRKMIREDVNHEGKVSRIREHINLIDYTEIHAYGDSNGDAAMLKIATHPNYRLFN